MTDRIGDQDRGWRLGSLACALALGALSCGLGFGRPHGQQIAQENPDCAWEGDAALDEDLQVGAPTIEIGNGADASTFAAWMEDDEVDPVVGGQGLEMVTPTVRVVDGAEIDEHCLHVSIELREAGAAKEETPVASAQNAYEFTAEANDLYAGPIWVPFEIGEVEGTYDLSAVVTGEGWQSVTDLRIAVGAT